MLKSLLYSIIILSVSCWPVMAEEYDARACNHTTSNCYDAEVSLDDGIVIINFNKTDFIKLDLDDDYPDDLTAYDEDKNVYYDIELIK